VATQGLVRRFGDFTAVRSVSLEVRQGEIFGLVGPNGSGKTTLLRMVCGLLEPTAGAVKLFDRPVDPRDQQLHRRLGYMSQGFTLYTELTVRQNLALHGRLFGLPEAQLRGRVRDLAERFGMTGVLDEAAEDLPLGMRQRLSLAVAVIHEPELLILDEPTSGVDPVARDAFWQLLGQLAAGSGATIVVSTHNLAEASRCDRVALMHAGEVLACDSPEALVRREGAATLEDAFIALLGATGQSAAPDGNLAAVARPAARWGRRAWRAAPRRLRAICRREALEILRDRFHLIWAVAVPLALLLIFGFGLSLDLDHLAFAVLDRDRTPESRAYIDYFAATPYFDARPPAATQAELERRLTRGELRLALEIPPGFGRELRRGRSPAVGAWIDGTMPYRAEGTTGYAMAAQESFLRSLGGTVSAAEAGPRLEVRYWFNQSLESKYAFVPALLAVVLLLMPATLTAVGVVREKEFGSITILYATPLSRLEFALGKQFTHAVIGLVNFAAMTVLVVGVFGVPLRGSFAALATGAVLFLLAGTALGLVIGAVSRTQTAAVLVTLIVALIPSFQYSGVMFPVSALRGPAFVLGRCLPSSYFVSISTGTFSKSLGFAALWPDHLALAGFAVGLTAAGVLLLRKQGG
jgi:ribosome-dependent ATPase